MWCALIGFFLFFVSLPVLLKVFLGRNQQAQGDNQGARRFSISWGKVLIGIGFAIVMGSILIGNLDRMADERYERQKEDEKQEAARLIVVEEDKERVEAVQASIERWLSISSAFSLLDGWTNLDLDLVKISKTEKLIVFPIVPYAGTHLPPVELALAPAGTVFLREDTEMYGGIPDRYLWVVYQGKKLQREAIMAGNSIDSPSLLLETTRHSDGDLVLGSECKVIVRYPDLAAAGRDRRRLVLERLFTAEEDFNQSIRVMDLPTVIEGVPVCWDLVVRCYPAWKDPDDLKRGGRWMPSPFLDQNYLALSPPSLRIEYSETYENESLDVLDGVAVLPLPEEATSLDDPDKFVIWRDNGGLLSTGCFKTSSKEMTGRVLAWRKRNGYPSVAWNGGESLYIRVDSSLDRHAGDGESLIGVTVRVVLMVQERSS